MKNEELEYKFPVPYFPDWDEARSELAYRAFDADGALYYYTEPPVLYEGSGVWRSESGTYSRAGKASERWASKIWRNSLEWRPESQTEK
jgi:hypothetical protein